MLTKDDFKYFISSCVFDTLDKYMIEPTLSVYNTKNKESPIYKNIFKYVYEYSYKYFYDFIKSFELNEKETRITVLYMLKRYIIINLILEISKCDLIKESLKYEYIDSIDGIIDGTKKSLYDVTKGTLYELF